MTDQSDSVSRAEYDALAAVAERAIEQCHELKRQRDTAMRHADEAIEAARSALALIDRLLELR